MANVIKLFTAVSYDFHNKLERLFVAAKLLQLCLMFAVEHFKGASQGQAMALPTNIKLGCKGLTGADALA